MRWKIEDSIMCDYYYDEDISTRVLKKINDSSLFLLKMDLINA